MSSWSGIEIGGMVIFETQNHYDEWYFKKSERVVEKILAKNYYPISDHFGESETVKIYRYKTTAEKIRRRLLLQGYDKHTLIKEFDTQRQQMIEDCVEMIKLSPDYKFAERLRILQESTLDDWLIRLKRIYEEKLRSSDYGNPDKDYGDGLLNLMLSTDHFVFSDHPTAGGFDFPCLSHETYAVALLEFLPNDAECILDVTDLVEAGWTDGFDDVIEFHQEHTKFYSIFKASLNEILVLTKLAPENVSLARMLFANVITVLETYLSDTFKKQVIKRDAILRRFIKHHDAFNKNSKRYSISEIYDVMDNLLTRVNSEIDKMSFHNMETVPGLYQFVLSTNFPKELGELVKAVHIRHDIVHRNGKNPQGVETSVSMQNVVEVASLVDTVILHIDRQVKDGLLDDID